MSNTPVSMTGHPHSPLLSDRMYSGFYTEFHACLGAMRMYEALWLYDHGLMDAERCCEMLHKPAKDKKSAVEMIEGITRLEVDRRKGDWK